MENGGREGAGAGADNRGWRMRKRREKSRKGTTERKIGGGGGSKDSASQQEGRAIIAAPLYCDYYFYYPSKPLAICAMRTTSENILPDVLREN